MLEVVACGLFVADGFNGTDGHGAVGGGQSGQHAQHEEEQAGAYSHPEADLEMGRGVGGGGYQGLDALQDGHTEADAHHAGQGGKDHAFRQNLVQDVLWTGTDGPADANLGGALLDGDHHDVAYADGTGQQGTQSHHPGQDADAREKVVNHAEHGFGIDHDDGLLVVGMDVVGLLHGLFDTGSQVADAIAGAGGDAHQIDALALVVSLLHGGERQGDAFLGTSVDVDVAGGQAHPYDAVVDAVYPKKLAAGIPSLGKEPFVNLLADDTHLPLFEDIDWVDEASPGKFLGFDGFVFGVESAHEAVGFKVTVIGGSSPAAVVGGDHLQFGYCLADTLQVVGVEVPDASLPKSLVGFAGAVAAQEGGIGGKALEVGRHEVLQSLSAAHEGNQHEDAPEYAKGSE